MQPSSGAIRLQDSADIAKLGERQLRPLRKRIQVVFQDPYRSLNPRRTAGASIVEGPMNFGLAEDKALERARSADAPRRAFVRTRSIATRTSSPAASASASPSPARSPWSRRC